MSDIPPDDIDPDTGRPYPGYSSPSLDTSFHDHEMNVDLDEDGDDEVDVSNLSPEVIDLLVRPLIEQGALVRAPGGYQLTDKGRALARLLELPTKGQS